MGNVFIGRRLLDNALIFGLEIQHWFQVQLKSCVIGVKVQMVFQIFFRFVQMCDLSRTDVTCNRYLVLGTPVMMSEQNNVAHDLSTASCPPLPEA